MADPVKAFHAYNLPSTPDTSYIFPFVITGFENKSAPTGNPAIAAPVAALKAYNFFPFPVTYTIPLDTAGDVYVLPPVLDGNPGIIAPVVALKAYNPSFFEPTYTIPLATAGAVVTSPKTPTGNPGMPFPVDVSHAYKRWL